LTFTVRVEFQNKFYRGDGKCVSECACGHLDHARCRLFAPFSLRLNISEGDDVVDNKSDDAQLQLDELERDLRV
jgi:hypothetical protein